MKMHRTQQADAAGAGLGAAITVGVVLCSQCLVGCQQGNQMSGSSGVTECRVSFRTYDGQAFAAVCLEDDSLIKNLVLQPMKNAKPDPKPADYAALGTLTIVSPGVRESFLLFAPWGHFKRGNEYFVADFSELQATCETALQSAQRRIDADRT